MSMFRCWMLVRCFSTEQAHFVSWIAKRWLYHIPPLNMHILLCKDHITLPLWSDSRRDGGSYRWISCRRQPIFLSDSVATESIPSKRFPYPTLTSHITVTNPRKAKVKVYFITRLVRFLGPVIQVHLFGVAARSENGRLLILMILFLCRAFSWWI